MTYFGTKLRQALSRPEHVAIVATPSRKLASLSRDSRNVLEVHYRSFDSFLDSMEAKRRIR